MVFTVSRVKHERFPEDCDSLRHSRTVQALMYPHLRCVAGDGITTERCGARKQLTAAALAQGWAWVREAPYAAPD